MEDRKDVSKVPNLAPRTKTKKGDLEIFCSNFEPIFSDWLAKYLKRSLKLVINNLLGYLFSDRAYNYIL